MKKLTNLLAATALTAAAAVPAAAEKWDMPMAYSASNFHSATGAEFAKCVTTGTGGDIEITTHPSGSLFKGGDFVPFTPTFNATGQPAISVPLHWTDGEHGHIPVGIHLVAAYGREDEMVFYIFLGGALACGDRGAHAEPDRGEDRGGDESDRQGPECPDRGWVGREVVDPAVERLEPGDLERRRDELWPHPGAAAQNAWRTELRADRIQQYPELRFRQAAFYRPRSCGLLGTQSRASERGERHAQGHQNGYGATRSRCRAG